MHGTLVVLLAAAACSVAGCKCSSTSHPGASPDPSASASLDPASSSAPAGVDLSAAPTQGPVLAAKGLWVVIRDKPSESADKIGYVRLGGIVKREDNPVSKAGCPGGWYKVEPRGYACNDDDASLDPQDPIVRAASRRPDLDKPMPYAYGFVRAVLPLYLKVPTAQEQLDSEFKLKDHLDWFNTEGRKLNREVALGANDVFTDSMGIPRDDVKVKRLVTDMTEGELFGGNGDDDPIPWWLDGGRKIPNVSGFKVPDFAVFADRARRHAGLSFVGSFQTGADSFNRRFGITVDLRLAPASKVKPDRGSPFHGVELTSELALPIAWVNDTDVRQYKIDGDNVRAYKKTVPLRTVVKLTGQKKFVDRRLYYEGADGKWLRSSQIAIASAPETMPDAAKAGEKWVDVSIMQQTLVLWEGQKPVYATLVSTGQDMMGDPKTTKSTVRGTFRIFAKHVTTAMDSNEGLTRDTGDPEYGKTKRRGQGTFLLADVPWVEYFKGSYALHGTYWHDVFGHARSHGCVNLSPIDAHRVFFWTTPNVPQGWHGVYARGDNGQGTVVYIHE